MKISGKSEPWGKKGLKQKSWEKKLREKCCVKFKEFEEVKVEKICGKNKI